MTKQLALAAAVMGLFTSLPASADIIGFTGPFAAASWATAVTGTFIGGSSPGSVLVTPTTATIVGGNGPGNPDLGDVACVGGGPGFGPCQINFTHPTAGFSRFLVHWAYNSADIGGASSDEFGTLVNGTRTSVSDPGGQPVQSGDLVINATAGTFGFFINCSDCVGGAATVTLTNFVAVSPAAVAEPASFALVGLGLAGLGALRRRKNAQGA